MIDIVVEAAVIGVAALWTVLTVTVAEGERRGRVGRRQPRVEPTEQRPISVPFGGSRTGRSHAGYRFPEYPTRA
jgi:hypothetical protein